MKKILQKKSFIIFLGILVLIATVPTIIFAIDIQNSYQTIPLTNSGDIVSQRGSTTIVNRSDKKYFVPNKTTPEWDAFAKNAPKYVSVSVCGDGTCSEGETTASCPGDCPISGYCGDGICDKSTSTRTQVTYVIPQERTVYGKVCDQKMRGWMWVPIVNVVLLASDNATYTQCDDVFKTVKVSSEWVYGSETWDDVVTSAINPVITCKDDCAAPTNATGCGVCGYDANGSLCPNYCNDGGYNLNLCIYKDPYTIFDNNIVALNGKPSLKKYLTADEALAVTDTQSYDYNVNTYRVAGSYTCAFGSNDTNFCPAGSYCPFTGGLKPGTTLTASLTAWLTSASGGKNLSDLQKTCDPGFFCPTAASYERPCPINTYSTGSAAECTSCPAGTKAMGRSTTAEMCQLAYKAGDGVCNIGNGTIGENPTNSPYDCPDANQAGTLWKGDGRCSGAETMTNSPSDCSCGNGICDNGETYLSCLADCACLDGVCGTTKTSYSGTTYGPKFFYAEVYKEGKYCTTDKGSVLNPSDCKNMNDGEVCGNGVCEAGEGYSSSLGHFVCPVDCHCGNGKCDTGEFYSNYGHSCNSDCACGNGVCDSGSPYYENSSNCMADCHCGNYVCEFYSPYTENNGNCYSDCHCGDNICSYSNLLNNYFDMGETTSTCPTDCSTTCDGDHKCEPENGEYRANCADCKYDYVYQYTNI